jgi:hypothetical protein
MSSYLKALDDLHFQQQQLGSGESILWAAASIKNKTK